MRKILREDGHKKALFTDRVFDQQNVNLVGQKYLARKIAQRNLEKSQHMSIEPLVASKNQLSLPQTNSEESNLRFNMNISIDLNKISKKNANKSGQNKSNFDVKNQRYQQRMQASIFEQDKFKTQNHSMADLISME